MRVSKSPSLEYRSRSSAMGGVECYDGLESSRDVKGRSLSVSSQRSLETSERNTNGAERKAQDPGEDDPLPKEQLVRSYLQHLLRLRYRMTPFGNLDDSWFRTTFDKVKPLAMYLKWWTTGDSNVALELADALGAHPIDLDCIFQPRLDALMLRLGIDRQYVEARLMVFADTGRGIDAYHQLAYSAQWSKLAAEVLDDKKHFETIFPGETLLGKKGTCNMNMKGQVSVLMGLLRGHYFAQISPNNYKLSKTAKRIDQEYRRAQKVLKEETKERQRTRNGKRRREGSQPYGRYEPGEDGISKRRPATAKQASKEPSNRTCFNLSAATRTGDWIRKMGRHIVLRL